MLAEVVLLFDELFCFLVELSAECIDGCVFIEQSDFVLLFLHEESVLEKDEVSFECRQRILCSVDELIALVFVLRLHGIDAREFDGNLSEMLVVRRCDRI